MRPNESPPRFVFPKWTNEIRLLATVAILGGLAYAVFLVAYGLSPETTNVGYAPEQPVPYSHALHAGELGIDCRYCHTTVERTRYASLPPTQTCMNCHSTVKTESELLAPVRESFATGLPIEWVRVHDLPGFVYFDHSAHVTRGVSCVSCHGRVDQMEVVRQAEPLSMGWCLDCHRDPEPHLRPVEAVTDLAWTAPADVPDLGATLRRERDINPSTDCSTCHR
jgi:hypothetical protein